MDRFLTTYNKDYKSKKISKVKKYFVEQEYKDPIGEGFKDYLKMESNGKKLNSKEEYADKYLEKFKEIYPKLGKIYFQEPINNPIVQRNFIMNGQTVYQADYCDSEKDRAYLEQLRKKDTIVLPPEWIIPQTTALTSYRDPRLLEHDALNVIKPIKPSMGDWGTSNKVADILQVMTGKSEYQGVIGELGDIIINDQIHGKIVHPKCGCARHTVHQE